MHSPPSHKAENCPSHDIEEQRSSATCMNGENYELKVLHTIKDWAMDVCSMLPDKEVCASFSFFPFSSWICTCATFYLLYHPLLLPDHVPFAAGHGLKKYVLYTYPFCLSVKFVEHKVSRNWASYSTFEWQTILFGKRLFCKVCKK